MSTGGRSFGGIAAQTFSAALAQYGEGAIAGGSQFRDRVGRDAGFEHRGVISRLGTREGQIGFAHAVERGECIGTAIVEGARQRGFELLESAQRDIGQQIVAVAEVAIRRRRADAGPARGIGKGEAGGALLRNQFEGGTHERFAQIAVVIAARAMPVVLRPAHVNSFYISAAESSTSRQKRRLDNKQSAIEIPQRKKGGTLSAPRRSLFERSATLNCRIRRRRPCWCSPASMPSRSG